MSQATVRRNDPAGTDLRLLTLDGPPGAYDTPGQFVTVTVADRRPAFFAVASSPGQPTRLLVKQWGDTAEVLGGLQPGETFEMSDALGKGFAMERVAGRELVVLVNGSGVAAAHPVVEAELARGLPRPVHLYYGVKSPDRRSFLADLERWANAGVTVWTVVSEHLADNAGWTGPTGHVQDIAREHGLVRDDVGVVMVGHKAMLEEARLVWEDAGCPPERLLTNF